MMTVCAECGKRIVVTWPEFYVYKRGKGEDTCYFCSENCMIVADTREMKDRIGWVDPQAEMTEEEIEAVTHGRPVGFRRLRKTARREEQPAVPAEKDRPEKPAERTGQDMGNSKNSHKLTREEKEKAVELAIGGKDPLSYLRERCAQNPSAAWWYIKKTLAKSNPKLLEKIPEKLGTVLDEKGQAVPADDSEAADPLEGFTAFDPGAPTGNPAAPTGNPAAPTGNPAAPTGNPAAPTGNPAAMVSSAMDPGAPEDPRDRVRRIVDDLFRFPENVTAEQNPAGRVVLDKDGVHLEPPKEPKKPDWEKTTFFGIPCEVTGMKVEEFEFRRIGNDLMMDYPGPGFLWMDKSLAAVKLTVEQWKRVIDLVPKVMKIFGMDK